MTEKSELHNNPGQMIKSARELVKQKKIKDAIKILEELGERGLLKKSEIYQLGRLYLEEQQWEQARDMFEAVMKEDPGHMKAFAGIRTAFEQLKDFEGEAGFLEALLLNRELKKRQVRHDILVQLKEIYENSENLILLVKILENLHALDPGNKDLVLDLARSYIELDKKDEQAMEIYEKAYQMAHELPALERQLSMTYSTLGRDRWRHLDICIQYYRNNPDDLENVKFLTSAFMKKDETIDDAIENLYETSLEKGLFDRGVLLYHLGLFYERRKKFAQAQQCYQESHDLGFGESNHYPLKKLGLLYESQKDLAHARASLVMQCKKFPGDEDSLKAARRVLLSPALRDTLSCEELRLAKTLIEADPSLKDYLFVARCLVDKCMEFGIALKCYQAASVIDPGNLAVLCGIKNCMIALEEFGGAAETIENILTLRIREDERKKYLLELAGIYSEHLNDTDRAISSLDAILARDPSHYEAHMTKAAMYEEAGKAEKYYQSLREAWRWHIRDERLLKALRDYFRKSGNSGAIEVISEILSFLGAEKKETHPVSQKLRDVTLDGCIHSDEKKGKGRLDSYKSLLQIKLNGSYGELDALREAIETFELTTDWKKARNLCFDFLGEVNATIYSYNADAIFKIKVFQKEEDNIMIINLPHTDLLPGDIKTCLMAQGFAHLRLEHPRYQEYIKKINNLINQQVDKVINYFESTTRDYSDFLKAPLFFMIRLLKQGKLRKTLLEKILANVESIKQNPLLLEMIQDLFKLVLLEEGTVREFIRGFSYSADRIAYAVSKNLLTTSLSVLYDADGGLRTGEIPPARMAELLQNPEFLRRIAELWQFALDVEVKEQKP